MRDARRYEDLAAYARRHGFPKVTGPRVHNWVKRGIVPRGRWIAWGFGRRSAVYPIETGRQLVAACELRFTEKRRDLDLVALGLWLKGYDVPFHAVRQGLGALAESPSRVTALSRAPGADVWDVANIAVRERGFGSSGRGSDSRPVDLAEGLGDFLGILTGEISAADAREDGLVAIARMIGLDRASSDPVIDDKPWLAGRAADALREVSAELTTEALTEAIGAASDDDLNETRDAVEQLAPRFVAAAQRFAEAGDPEYAGYGMLGEAFAMGGAREVLLLALLARPDHGRAFFQAVQEAERAGSETAGGVT